MTPIYCRIGNHEVITVAVAAVRKLIEFDSRAALSKHWPGQRPMEDGVSVERRVRLFRNGRNQAVRIPREMELPGKEVIVCREGDRLVVAPVPPVSLLAVLATLEPINEDFLSIEDLPARPVDL